MKYWWQSVVKDYFTFSKKERKSLLFFLLVLAVIILLPVLFKSKPKVYSKDAFQLELAQLDIKIDSSRSGSNYDRYSKNDDDNHWQPDRKPYEIAKGEFFVFDPNTLSAEGWKKLGVRDRTVQTIQKFVAKGFKFRKPEDIRKVYGLRPEEASRLIPFIKIEGAEEYTRRTDYTNNSTTFTARPKEDYTPRVIDINSADTAMLIALPGIGSKLALRIVNFRDRLGGFITVAQVAETYGVPDSTFQKIKPRLACSKEKIRTININSADANTLKTHPYIKWNIANAIVNYRKQHGNFRSVEDLKKIDIIDEEVFAKMAPYFVL
ncbi:MAG: hypothetical protein JWQ96_2739 [Segetibacter sp.]|nr:hypothetical protein [Segetibacter sp.]